jgi:hypothetical protein
MVKRKRLTMRQIPTYHNTPRPLPYCLGEEQTHISLLTMPSVLGNLLSQGLVA